MARAFSSSSTSQCSSTAAACRVVSSCCLHCAKYAMAGLGTMSQDKSLIGSIHLHNLIGIVLFLLILLKTWSYESWEQVRRFERLQLAPRHLDPIRVVIQTVLWILSFRILVVYMLVEISFHIVSRCIEYESKQEIQSLHNRFQFQLLLFCKCSAWRLFEFFIEH